MKRVIKYLLLILSVVTFAFGVVACSGGASNQNQEVKAQLNLLAAEYTLEVGGTQKIAYEYDGKAQVTFSSSNGETVSVGTDGKITAIKRGTAFITLTAEDLTAICRVNVLENEYGVNISFSEYTMVVGSSINLSANALTNGKITEDILTWNVEQENVEDYQLSVSGNSAIFKASNVGYYTVKASSEKANAICTIKVIEKNATRADTPIVTVEHCDTLKWDLVNGIETYEVYIDGNDKIKVTGNSLDITDFIGVEKLPHGASLKIMVKTKAENNFNYADSYYAPVIVSHDYALNETVDATCYSVGTMVYTCNNCDRTYTDSNYYEDHNYLNGTCTVCDDLKTEGVLYFYDNNFIPMPTPKQAADENSEWRVTYADYYTESDVEGGSVALWIAVTENKEEIPEEQRIECYYVHGLKDETLTEVYLTDNYNDGVHGRLPVKYVRSGAFNNDVIRTVIMPEGISEIRGGAFGGSDSLETVVAPGVKYLPGIDKPQLGYLMGAFSNSLNLKSVVLGEGILNEAMSFRNRYYTGNEKGTADIYVYANNLEGVNMLAKPGYEKFNQILSGKIYPFYQTSDQIYCEDFWHFDEKGLPVISQHDYKDGGACVNCGATNPGNLKYGYDGNFIAMPTPSDVENSSSEWMLKYAQYAIAEEQLTTPEQWWKAVYNNRIAIPLKDRIECYYVKGTNDYAAKKYVIPETYSGAQGTLPVKYVGYSAFMNNKNITEIIATETLTELRGASFSGCTALQTAVFPGVKYLQGHDLYMFPYYSRMANFDYCDSLTKLVVAGGFKARGNHFRYSNTTQVTDKIRLYVYADTTAGVNPKLSDPDTKWNKLMTDSKFVYDDIADGIDCLDNKKWHFDQNGIPVRNEHEYVDGACKHCGAIMTTTVAYAYNDNFVPMPTPDEIVAGSAWRAKYEKYLPQGTDKTALTTPELWWKAIDGNKTNIAESDRVKCYYVSGLVDVTLSEVIISATFNDGVHGTLPVKYIANRALQNNANIKKVVASESLTELRGRAFASCTNLTIAILPGVKYLSSLYSETDANLLHSQNFNACSSLKKLVVGGGFKSAGQNFKGDTGGVIRIYNYGVATSSSTNLWIGSTYARYNALLTETIFAYDETGLKEGKFWHFDQNGIPVHNVHVNVKPTGAIDNKCDVCGDIITND